MAKSGIKAASKSDATSPGEQMLDFDDETLKAIAEVYNNEGNDECGKKHYSNAVYFYTEGIKVNLKDDELKAELYSNRAEAHFCLGNYRDSLRDAKAATDLQPSLVKARIITGANALVKLNLFEEAITWCDKGLAIDKENTTLLELRKMSMACADEWKSNSETGATDDKLSQGNECKHGVHNRDRDRERPAYNNLDDAYLSQGVFKQAIKFHQQVLSIAKGIGSKDLEGEAYLNLGHAYYSLDDFIKAMFQQALSIAKDIGSKDLEANAYLRLGVAYNSLGDFKQAIEFHQQALSIAKCIQSKDLEGEAYNNLGIVYCRLADFNKAIEFHQQALSIAKDVGSKDLEAVAYSSLGVAYNSLGDFKQAIEFHQQALSIAKDIGRKDFEANAYLRIGVAYNSLGDFKQAIEFHQQALSIAKYNRSKDLEGEAYNNLGIVYYSLADFKQAIEFHQQALNIAKDIGRKHSEGTLFLWLGCAYESLGNYKKAIEFHQQALSIAKDVRSKDSETRAYLALGRAYDSLGDFNKAIEFHQQALIIAKYIRSKDLEGKAYNSLGLPYHSLGDFKKAIDFYQQALSIAKDIRSKHLEEAAYNNLGLTYISLADYNKASEFHQQALSIAKDIGSKQSELKSYNNLGLAFHSFGNFEKAIEFYQQALSIAKYIGSKDSEGKAYNNIGFVYYSLGDFKQAIEFHQQALSIAKDIGSKDSEGKAYLNLGAAHYCLGDFKNAIKFHQQTLSIAKGIGSKDLEAQAYVNLGVAYDYLGDFSRAEDFFKSSVRLVDELRVLLQSIDKWNISFRNKRDEPYSKLWRIQLKQGKVMEALFSAEQGRAQALMDLMESQYGVHSARSVSEEQMSGISRHISSPTIFIAKNQELLNFWVLQEERQCQFMQKEIGDNLETLTQEAYKQIGVFESIMCENRSLDEPGDEGSKEFPNRSPIAKELSSSVGNGDALKVLSDVIIGPISHLIRDDELIIVPDGPLLLVPYAALVDQDSRYFTETVRIRLVPTLTSLKLIGECPEGRHSTSGALLVGDPWVETVRIKGNAVRQLPSAKEEVEMIGEIMNIEPLTGKNATKAQVLSRLNSVSLIHIAAHGCAETGEILLSPNSASSKTPGAPTEKDYLLTMADVLNANLHAKLVVLSCCHSGRGKIKAEGVVGIARAFLGAGARSVIASLWAIDDDATLEFMRKFYEHLMAGQSTSKSLNQAMKWMRESQTFSSVKYWAPFVLIGDDVTFNFGQTSDVSVQ